MNHDLKKPMVTNCTCKPTGDAEETRDEVNKTISLSSRATLHVVYTFPVIRGHHSKLLSTSKPIHCLSGRERGWLLLEVATADHRFIGHTFYTRCLVVTRQD